MHRANTNVASPSIQDKVFGAGIQEVLDLAAESAVSVRSIQGHNGRIAHRILGKEERKGCLGESWSVVIAVVDENLKRSSIPSFHVLASQNILLKL